MKKILLLSAAAISASMALAGYRTLIYTNGSLASETKVSNITGITASGENLVQTTDDGVKTFKVTDVDSMVFVSDTVYVTYNGSAVVVTNPLQNLGLSIVTSGADVVVTEDNSTFDMKDVVFVLSGTSTNGSFYMDQQKRVSVVLDNLTLTSGIGAALALEGDKGVSLELNGTNVLKDATTRLAADTTTSALYVNDKLEVSGNGSLSIVGTYKNGIFVKDDFTLNGGTLTVTSQKSAVRVKDNLVVNAGSLEVLNTNAGDGVDVNDTIFVNGGSLIAAVSASDSKAITCDGGFVQTSGIVTANVVSGADGSKGIKVGSTIENNDTIFGNLLISGGTCNVTLTNVAKNEEADASPAGMKCDGIINITGGNVTVSADLASSAVKGVSADTAIYVHGTSVVNVSILCSKGKAWCFKSDGKIYVKPSCVTATFNTDNSKYDSDAAGYYSPAYTKVDD